MRGDDLTLGEGRLWVADDLASTVTPLNLGAGNAGQAIPLPGAIDDLAAGESGLWVLDRSGGTVTEIDAETLAVRSPIGIGPGGTSIAVGFGAVWVTNYDDRSLIRIDPVTSETETFDVRASVLGVVPDEFSGKLWLSVLPS